MHEMVIYGVSFDMVGKTPIVLLKTIDGNRFLPIWVGHPEAAAILIHLQGARPGRPSTHDLFIRAMSELDATVSRATITELRDNTFLAEVTIEHAGNDMVLDSRPSDAIALAIRAEAQIFAGEELVAEHSIEFEQETMGDSESMVKEFQQFLDDVSPSDFGNPEN